MNLGIEYLVRTDLIKGLFTVPCSLFLTNFDTGAKLVITISNEFTPTEFYNVKHWNITACKNEQVLPSFAEYQVPKNEVFTSHYTVVNGYRLLSFTYGGIPIFLNSIHGPMEANTYEMYYNGVLTGIGHFQNKENWLWREFTKIYVPHLSTSNSTYIPKPYSMIANEQRSIVYAYYKDLWQYWEKWMKYLLDFPGIHGELLFRKEYS